MNINPVLRVLCILANLRYQPAVDIAFRLTEVETEFPLIDVWEPVLGSNVWQFEVIQ